MFKYLMATVVALTFVACGTTSTRSSTQETIPQQPTSSTTITAGGDVTINDVEVSGNGTYVQNDDGTITYQTGDGSINEEGTNDGAAGITGTYSSTDSEKTCTSKGYFWCPLENKCLNQPANGGTCTSNAAMSISIYSDGIQ